MALHTTSQHSVKCSIQEKVQCIVSEQVAVKKQVLLYKLHGNKGRVSKWYASIKRNYYNIARLQVNLRLPEALDLLTVMPLYMYVH